MMPIMDGLFSQKSPVRTQHSLIFLTAKSQKEDVVEGFRTGADDYITKLNGGTFMH